MRCTSQQWLARLFALSSVRGKNGSFARRELLCEMLEARTLLAGDSLNVCTWAEPVDVTDDARTSSLADLVGVDDLKGEGEAGGIATLASFAQELAQQNVRFFGVTNCLQCDRQKELFGDAQGSLPYIDVADISGDPSLNPTGRPIVSVPTWEFQDLHRVVGFMTLRELSEHSGILLPPDILTFRTNVGPIDFQLLVTEAPNTVDNFLNYVNRGDYVGTIFHRTPQNSSHAEFVVHGGGYAPDDLTTTDLSELMYSHIATDPPIPDERDDALGIADRSNTFGTVAMAKDASGATSEFYVNMNDNSFLDAQGFTVFALALGAENPDGSPAATATVNEIAALEDQDLGMPPFQHVPYTAQGELVVVESIEGTGAVTGVVFADQNKNGARDPGEPGLAGVTIFSDTDDDGAQDIDELSTTTAGDGGYMLVLPSGTHTIRELSPPGFVLTTLQITIDVPVARTRSGQDFANEQPLDLVAFAQDLAASGTRFYGAAWCPHCTAQKHLFEDGGQFLPFIEVTNLDNPVTLNAVGRGEDLTLNPSGVPVTAFPTWEFPDGSRLLGHHTLQTLSQRSGVPIPMSGQPFIAPVDDGDQDPNDVDADGDDLVTLLAGSPLHIALNGYDPGGGPLTYTVSSSNSALVSATLRQGNRNMEIDVAGWGKMNFQLFEQRAPRPTSRLIELAELDFYDNVTFHSIVDGFVIKAGDPTGTGSGGSALGDFDDQFHEELQHNRTGTLSITKSYDDTNDSQFFITESASSSLRELDGNYSVSGTLVEGEIVREAISSNSTTNPRNVVMNSVDVFHDTENAVVMLSASEGASGTSDITVTATDVDGNTFTRTFTVNVQPDSFNTRPWLDDFDNLLALEGTTLSTTLQALDVEGDPIQFGVVSPANFSINVPTEPITPQSPALANVTVTPNPGFVGQEEITFFVYDPNQVNLDGVNVTLGLLNSNTAMFDVQTITVTSLGLDLLAASDSGFSNSDNTTNIPNMVFAASGVTPGATVTLRSGDTVIGVGDATAPTIEITTDILAAGGEGTHDITITQTIGGEEGNRTPPLQVTLDTTGPTFTSSPIGSTLAGSPYLYDAQTDDETGAGAAYMRVDPMTGDPIPPVPGDPVVNPTQGTFAWDPSFADVGQFSFAIRAADLAGNATTQVFELEVIEPPTIGFRLEATKDGQPVIGPYGLAVGDQFRLNVFVDDIRNLNNPADGGVLAAYLDVLYDSTLAEVAGTFTYGSEFSEGRSGDTSTPDVIDHGGAFTHSIQPIGQGEVLLWSLPFTATAPGTMTFVGEPTTDPDDPGDAGQSPLYDSGVYDAGFVQFYDPVCPSGAPCFGTMEFADSTITIFAADFGDAPTLDQSGFANNYPTRFADNGALHTIDSLRLGALIDPEADGQPDPEAQGDDDNGDVSNAIGDEDGVLFIASLVTAASSPTTSSVVISSSGEGFVDAWIDFGQNGAWNEPGEQILTSVPVSAGDNVVSFAIPAGVASGDTFARFRLSSTGGLSPTGETVGGEVEDYVVSILDGGLGADVEINKPLPGTLEVVAEGSDVVVRSGATVLFQSPGGAMVSLDIRGTEDSDTLSLANLDGVFNGPVTCDGQGGVNSFLLSGHGQTLDLTQIPDGSLQNMDVVDISGSGKNVLSLDAQEVLDISATDTLTVRADSGATSADDDIVDIGKGWVLIDTEVDNGDFVRILHNSGAILRSIGPRDWCYPENRLDTNASGSVEPMDVLIIINELNVPQFVLSENRLINAAGLSVFPDFFFDVFPDDYVSPIDALLVINFLNEGLGNAEGEAGVIGVDPVFGYIAGSKLTASVADQHDDDPSASSAVEPVVAWKVTHQERTLCDDRLARDCERAELLDAIDLFFNELGFKTL